MTVEVLTAQIRSAMDREDWSEAERLGDQLDRATHKSPVELVSAALWYASIGLQVFPLQPGDKVPHRGTRGCLDATTDTDRIWAWWSKHPDSNIGIATGYLVDVVDIDGPEGVKQWAALLCEPDGMPPVLGTVNTPRPGGSHLYVAAVEGRGNKARLFPGVDYRGLGGYVIAPPSFLAPDPTGKRSYHGPYTWRRPLDLEATAA